MAVQTVLEAAVKAGTTRGLQVSYPELNKHIDDPLNIASASAATEAADLEHGTLMARDRSGSFRHVSVDVPGPMRDQSLDLGRCGLWLHSHIEPEHSESECFCRARPEDCVPVRGCPLAAVLVC